MKLRNLLVAVVILVALGGLVWWSKRHPQSTSTTTTPAAPKLAAIGAGQVQSIDLTKKDGATLTLVHQNGKWTITSPEALPADQDAVSSLLSAINPITADSVVEKSSADLNKYGLNTPSLVVTVHETNGKTDRISFGDDVPAGSLVY